MHLKNLKMQMHERLHMMEDFGSSKHEAKKDYRRFCEENHIKVNPSKSMFIHSYSTADTYHKVVDNFGNWLKENENELWKTKDLDNIDKDICYEYLQERDESCSAYTVSRDMSGLNRVFNSDLTKQEGNLSCRSYKDITRSRNHVAMDDEVKLSNYSDQICYSYSFGLRRSSVYNSQYSVKDVSLVEKNEKIYCAVIEKGGKYREAPCLSVMEDYIRENYDDIPSFDVAAEEDCYTKEEFKELYKSSDNLLFDKYPSRIDNHSFRSKYATQLYIQYEKEAISKDIDIKNDYRGYNKEIILKVSHALGHNRASVVVEHYLRI